MGCQEKAGLNVKRAPTDFAHPRSINRVMCQCALYVRHRTVAGDNSSAC